MRSTSKYIYASLTLTPYFFLLSSGIIYSQDNCTPIFEIVDASNYLDYDPNADYPNSDDDACSDVTITFVGMPPECNCQPTEVIIETVEEGEIIRIAQFTPTFDVIRDLFSIQQQLLPNIFPFSNWEYFVVGGIVGTNFTPFQIAAGESVTFDLWTGVSTYPVNIFTNLDCDGDGIADQSIAVESTIYVECH